MIKNLLAAMLIFAATSSAMANYDNGREPVVKGSIYVNVNMPLEHRVLELERVILNLDQRVRYLESLIASHPAPPPPVSSSYTCMLVDSGYSKTFYAKGKTALESEYQVKQNCAKRFNSAYCQKVTKCSSGQMDSYARGYFCMATDSGYGKTFKGEGSDMVEAEAKAKQSCQETVNSAYCGNVQARCEAIR